MQNSFCKVEDQMISDESARDMLKAIELTGAVDEGSAQQKPIICNIFNGNMNQVLNFSSGTLSIQSAVARKFGLILSTPEELRAMSPFEIRCCLCRKVISYPSWYYSIKYNVNHFHYFICFDKNCTSKPTTRCYRKG